MLQSLLPEVKFDPASFSRCMFLFIIIIIILFCDINVYVLASWSDIANRRQFFENFANTKNFDFEKADNWYIQSRKEIMAQKVCYFYILF